MRSGTFRQGSGASVNNSSSRAFHFFPAKIFCFVSALSPTGAGRLDDDEIVLRGRESLIPKIIFTSQTAELLQVYGGQMDMIFSVHVNNGRVSIVENSVIFVVFADNFVVS